LYLENLRHEILDIYEKLKKIDLERVDAELSPQKEGKE
jgi:septum formation topological specificity factor MinE